jgi:hypothetical protein
VRGLDRWTPLAAPPGGIRGAIASTKVRGIERRGNDEYNHPVVGTTELEDVEVTPATELDVRPP